MLRWIRDRLSLRPAEGPDAAGRRGGERVQAWMRQGTVHHQAGELILAAGFYRQVLDEQPDHADALYLLGEIEARRQNNEHAATLIRRAISIESGKAQFHFALGCVQQGSGERREAADSYRRALVLDPSHAAAHINLGCLLQEGSEIDLAAGGPGGALAQRGFEEALSHFRAATEIAPEGPDGWINLGYALERQRRLADARHCYDRALALDPQLAQARFNRSMVLLAQGDYPEGWEDYEWRWQASGYPRPAFPQGKWDGSALRGETVLLYTEQGFGDAIQFVRYAAAVAERGGRAMVRCQPELQRLLRSVPGVSGTLAPHQTTEFDLHCPLLSLPRVLRTTIDTIPAQVPYIVPDPMLASEWRARLRDGQAGIKVGLVWASHSMMPNAGLKSTTLSAFAPLREVPGVRFYSLQTGAAGRQAATAGPIPLIDHTDRIGDFADTAALIANLDLIIAVDTAVAHLAGAMRKPVWTMLRYAPDWRWYPDTPGSSWYPSMRLYRQRVLGDWAGVCDEIAKDLRDFVAGSAAISPT
jgi:tetratricopeptide (TPR) repeat protein